MDTFQRDTTGHGTLSFILGRDGTGRGHFFEGQFGTQTLNQFRYGTPRDTLGWDGTLRRHQKAPPLELAKQIAQDWLDRI